jgi:hypothetical protein
MNEMDLTINKLEFTEMIAQAVAAAIKETVVPEITEALKPKEKPSVLTKKDLLEFREAVDKIKQKLHIVEFEEKLITPYDYYNAGDRAVFNVFDAVKTLFNQLPSFMQFWEEDFDKLVENREFKRKQGPK